MARKDRVGDLNDPKEVARIKKRLADNKRNEREAKKAIERERKRRGR